MDDSEDLRSSCPEVYRSNVLYIHNDNMEAVKQINQAREGIRSVDEGWRPMVPMVGLAAQHLGDVAHRFGCRVELLWRRRRSSERSCLVDECAREVALSAGRDHGWSCSVPASWRSLVLEYERLMANEEGV